MGRADQQGHCYYCPYHNHSQCRKHYKVLIDSGTAISLLWYSTYKKIEDCYKTPIQPTTAKLNTADGSPMMALGSTALHLWIAEFKFAQNFIICNQLPETELIFGIDNQKKFSLSYAWDKEKNCYIQRNGKFLVYTHSNTCMTTIVTVKSTLKIPSRHNGVVPIKISGPLITTHMAYFLTDDSTPKGRDPNINIIDGIHKIKGRTSVNILVSNYTNKHLTFHKGEYIGHLKPVVLDSTDQRDTHQTNSETLKKMMSETVTPNTFNPPWHDLSAAVQDNLKLLLQEYESQFAKDETTVGTTPLTSMTIDTGTSDPVSQKPYPIVMKDYQWVKKKLRSYLPPKLFAPAAVAGQHPL